MSATPPYLLAAFFCEKTLTEQDGVLSAIRIFDRVFVPSIDQKLAIPLNLFISFKGGGYTGKAKISIRPIAPSGPSAQHADVELVFPDAPHGGANLFGSVVLEPKEEGVYWFEIYANDELVTRIPLEVLQTPPQQKN